MSVPFEQRLYKALKARRTQMEEEIFTVPPTDWAAFKERQGQWAENQRLLEDVIRIAQIDEDDKEVSK